MSDGIDDLTIEELRAEVRRCHERLEIDRYFMIDKDSENLVRVDVPYAERDLTGHLDGIDCRNATIKGIDGVNDELRADLDKVLEAFPQARELIVTDDGEQM